MVSQRQIWWRIAQAVTLLVLVLVIYAPTLNNEFISDDHHYVGDAEKLASWDGLSRIWLDPSATPQYYPLTNTMFWIQHHVFGNDPRGYHLVNIVEQMIVVLLVWYLLHCLNVPGAWLAAALLAVHPVHVDTVAWISEQKNLLSCMLALGSILAYLRFAPQSLLGNREATNPEKHGPWGYYALSFLLYIAAVSSKTVAVSVPPVLLVIFWWKSGRFAWKEGLRLIPFLIVGVALSLVSVFVESVLLQARGHQWDLSWLSRFLVAGHATCFYLHELVWPHPLKFMYQRWNIDPHDWQQYLYPIAVLVVIVILWWFRNRIGRGPLAAIFLFLGIMAPALGFFNIHFFLYSYVADHFQYHASIAIFALVAAGIVIATQKLPQGKRAGQVMLAVAILLPLAIMARQRTYVYATDVTLTTDNLKDNPDSWAAQQTYGLMLQSQKRYREALTHHTEALRLFPDHGEIHCSIGMTLAHLKRYDEAVSELEQSISMKMTTEDTYLAEVSIAEIRKLQGRLKEAAAHYKAALVLKTTDSEALHKYRLILRQIGDKPAEIDVLHQMLILDSQNPDLHHDVGMLLMETGKLNQAEIELTQAAALAPDNARFQEDLAMLLFKLNRLDLAEKALKRAAGLNPKSANTFIGLGAIYGQRGEIDAAINAFQSALKADPINKQAADNLAKALKSKASPAK